MYVYTQCHRLRLIISKCRQVCFLKDRGTHTHTMYLLVCAESISRIHGKLAVTQGCLPGRELGGRGRGAEGALWPNTPLYLLNWEPHEKVIYSWTKFKKERLRPCAKG